MSAETESAEEPTGSRGAEGGVPRSGRTKRTGQGIEADTIHGATPSAKLLRSAAFRCLARVHARSGCQSSWLGLGRAARTGRGRVRPGLGLGDARNWTGPHVCQP